MLDELGMVWDKFDPWRERYELARRYQSEHGDLDIPMNYQSGNGIWLGSWLYRQRQYRRTGDPRLTAHHRRELDDRYLEAQSPSSR